MPYKLNPFTGEFDYYEIGGDSEEALYDALYLKSTIYTDTFNVADADTLCVCNKATAMTANLPAATGSNRILYIKNIGVGEVTVDGDGSETIDGETTQTLYQYEVMRVQDIASGVWVVI